MNVVLSSAGRRGALLRILQQTLRDMGRHGTVIAVDMSPLTAAGMMAEEFVQVPPCTAPEFISEMVELCRLRKVGMVVPTLDQELSAYAAHRYAFDEVGTRVLVSDPITIEICTDKRQTHAFLAENGFPTVSQAPLEEVLGALDVWEFPLIVKPVKGSASAGVAIVSGEVELRGLSATSALLVESRATGVEYTVDLWVDTRGRARCAVPRQRLEVRAGEVSKGMTVRNAKLEQLTMDICEALPGAYGPITIQAFVDGSQLTVIEINPRFGGGYPLSWQAGARFPQWAMEEIVGIESTATHSDWVDGLVMLRYDEAIFLEAGQVGL